jgi:YD repeat-containing protein
LVSSTRRTIGAPAQRLGLRRAVRSASISAWISSIVSGASPEAAIRLRACASRSARRLRTASSNPKRDYDQGANALGRLSSITETDPANQQTNLIQYAYDPHGRVTAETRTVNGVAYALGYSYDASGRLSGLTYQRAA